jgi:CheY-like chemotaxis protein
MRLTDFGGLDASPTPAVAASLPTAKVPSSWSSATPPPPVPDGRRGDMLLVAESLVEGRILYKRFQRYGLSIDWLREAGQALQLLKTHAYRVVAIDRLNGEPDVYQVCRSVKQRKLANGQSPVVIMFAPTAGSMDRMKAGLAGCDAYFSRAVGESDLYKCLAQHRLLSQRAFAKTDIGC